MGSFAVWLERWILIERTGEMCRARSRSRGARSFATWEIVQEQERGEEKSG